LLRVTASVEEDINLLGPGSLLSMCLRAIPQYIKKEEALLAEQLEESGCISAINRRDVSTEIYDDLEAFGSSGHGWKHLKTVVRSHGIQVISVAIQDGLIDMEFCGILVSLCVNMHATREAEIMLSALLSAGIFIKPKSVVTRFVDDIRTRPLSIFWKFAARRGSLSYQYRQLSRMISNGILHISWLATKEFISFWARAVREFPFNLADPNAIAFFNTALPLLATYGEPYYQSRRTSGNTDAVLLEAVRQTFSSLVATLSTIGILSRETVAQTEGPVVSPTSREQVIAIFRTCLAQWKLGDRFNIKGALLALAILMMESYDGYPPDFELVNLLVSPLSQTSCSAQLSARRKELATFFCSIARSCGRGISNSGFEYLRYLHTSLERFSHNKELNGGKIVQDIIVDSAFAFAQKVPEKQHLDYAASIEAKFHAMRCGSVTSMSEDADGRAGYRWEDGISEWVIATPVARIVKSATLGEESSVDGSDCETPFCHRNRRARLKYPVCSTLMMDLAPSSVSKHDYSDVSRPSTPGYESTWSDSYDDDDDTPTTSYESTVTSNSHKFYASDKEHLMGSLNDDDLEMDELCTPGSPPLISTASAGSGKRCRYSSQAPRLRRRVLRQSLRWQTFDESDDELSCLSASSRNSPWQDSTDGGGPNANLPALNRGERIPGRRKSTAGLETSFPGDSEDELGN
jgi:hypothetical protein